MVLKTKHKGFLFDDTPRGILEALLLTGGMAIALTAAPTLFIALTSIGFVLKAKDKQRRRRLSTSFQYLKREGYVKKDISKDGLRIKLTKEGHHRIKQYLNYRSLAQPPKRPAIWDGKWRLILFDIPTGDRVKRNAFRGLIRRLGAVMLQKSVWIYPFDCLEQINLLKDLFRFSSDEICLVIADSIGDDARLRVKFRI